MNVQKEFSGQKIDGYSIYLPRSHSKYAPAYPILVCLQGGGSVGGDVGRVNRWGVPLHLQKSGADESKLGTYLSESFIIVSPHLTTGEYYKHPAAIQEVVVEVLTKYRGDDSKVYLTGLSRGGSGTWGLASRMPGVFAAVAPIGGNVNGIEDYATLGGTPIWFGHNRADDVIPFQPVADVVSNLEKMDAQLFHRIDSANPPKPSDLLHDRILTSRDTKDHDAWTELYGDPNFYAWLLRQKRK